MTAQIVNIKMGRIHPCPDNPRKKISAEELAELSESIKSVGLLQPITVRQDSNGYEIVCGHRRYEAAKMAGLEEIPCIVRVLTDEESYEIMVTENLQRKDIDPFEEAQAFALLRSRGYDTEALTQKFGKSKTYVLSRMKLNCLIPEFRALYDDGAVDMSHLWVLSRLDSKLQKKLYIKSYQRDDYYGLRDRSVKELKNVISQMSLNLEDAPFNTAACARCPKNTCSCILFHDFSQALCEDPECYNRKRNDMILNQLERARELNPDFYVIDDGGFRNPSDDKNRALVAEIKSRGFRIEKDDYWAHVTYSDAELKKDTFIEDAKPLAFSLRWSDGEFVGPKKSAQTSSAAQKTPHKEEWYLDNIVRNLEERRVVYRTSLIEDDFLSMNNNFLLNYEVKGNIFTRALLMYFVAGSDESVTAFGISGGMDGEELATKLDAMDNVKAFKTLVKFASASMLESGENKYLEAIFPSIYGKDRTEAVNAKVYDECRKYWKDYDEVTDDMIREDLEQRVAKLNASKEEE